MDREDGEANVDEERHIIERKRKNVETTMEAHNGFVEKESVGRCILTRYKG